MFPRRWRWPLGALAVLAGFLVFAAPLDAVTDVLGSQVFREAGITMVALLGVSLVSSVALSVLGAFAVQGRRGPLASMQVIAPAAPIVTVMGVGAATTLMGVAVSDETMDPDFRLRLLAKGTAEIDALYIYGAWIGAAVLAATAVALLGAAASVAPSSPSRAARRTFVAGAVGTLLVFVVQRSAIVTAAFVVLTALAALAARNADFVRLTPERKEARGWLAAVLGAMVAAATSFGLFDFATFALAERRALTTLADAEPSLRLGLLTSLVAERHAAHRAIAIDVVVTIGVLAIGFVNARGRTRRRPLPLLLAAAFVPVVAAIGVLLVSRDQVATQLEKSTHTHFEAHAALPLEPTIDYRHGEHPIVSIDLHADPLGTVRSLSWYDRELGVYADGEQRWTRIMTSIAKQMRDRNHWFPHTHADTSPPDLSIRVRPRHDTPAPLEGYEVFLGVTEPMLRLTLAYHGLGKGEVLRDLPENATLNDVVAEYTKRGGAPVTVELPEEF